MKLSTSLAAQIAVLMNGPPEPAVQYLFTLYDFEPFTLLLTPVLTLSAVEIHTQQPGLTHH